MSARRPENDKDGLQVEIIERKKSREKMKKEKAVCVYLGEIHAQSHLRQQMHDDTFVFFNRFTFAVIISLIMTVKLI